MAGKCTAPICEKIREAFEKGYIIVTPYRESKSPIDRGTIRYWKVWVTLTGKLDDLIPVNPELFGIKPRYPGVWEESVLGMDRTLALVTRIANMLDISPKALDTLYLRTKVLM